MNEYSEKAQQLVAQLTLDEKLSLLTGKNFWVTQPFPRLGVSSMEVADGPYGLRKQVGISDHMGWNKSQPAVAYVSGPGMASSWDKDLIREAGRHLGVEAAAAVGQCELMYIYDKLFSEYNHTVAQILITKADIENPERSENFHNTLFKLLELGTLPIINENDTIATEEIVIGDNDTLAAIVAKTAGADLLVLLSDIDGLYTTDPRQNKDAQLISVVEEITPELEKVACGAGTKQGTGGMQTKLHAAKIATGAGVEMIISNGSRPLDLYKIVNGQEVGTRFKAGMKN